MLTRTWIDTHLSAAERTTLVEWLMERAQNPTGEQIRAGLGELFPQFTDDELPSIASCLAWRNKVWSWELQRRTLREDVQIAKVLTEAGGGGHFAAANRELAEAVLFDQLRALRQGNAEAIDPDALVAMMRGVATLANSSRADAELRVKLEKLEAEKAALARELNQAEAKGGITPETLERIREKVGLL